MKQNPPTDSEESRPIRLDPQGIPILQEVVITEADPDIITRQPPFTEPLSQPEAMTVETLRQELESRFQQVIETQVERLTGEFRKQITSALQQALTETLERLSPPDRAGAETDQNPQGGDGPAS